MGLIGLSTEYLRLNSDYYPEILIYDSGEGNISLSTLVRIEREGIWYIVHCVERAVIHSNAEMITLMLKFLLNVYTTQTLYTIAPPLKQADGTERHMQYVDKLQISEIERVKDRYYRPRWPKNTNPHK